MARTSIFIIVNIYDNENELMTDEKASLVEEEKSTPSDGGPELHSQMGKDSFETSPGLMDEGVFKIPAIQKVKKRRIRADTASVIESEVEAPKKMKKMRKRTIKHRRVRYSSPFFKKRVISTKNDAIRMENYLNTWKMVVDYIETTDLTTKEKVRRIYELLERGMDLSQGLMAGSANKALDNRLVDLRERFEDAYYEISRAASRILPN